jgi:hypothetical protein
MNEMVSEKFSIQGAWKLELFQDVSEDKTYHYTDILIFSDAYYSDFHVETGQKSYVNSHVGKYKISQNSITFQAQLSTDVSYVGRAATGTLEVDGDTLKIIFWHGRRPGVWTYSRLK